MEHKQRDTLVRKKMLAEIADIEAFISGQSEAEFEASKLTQKAVMMSLINIGELSKAFSEEYLEATSTTPWKAVRGLRNIAAHHYEAIRAATIWATMVHDIPALKEDLLNHPL